MVRSSNARAALAMIPAKPGPHQASCPIPDILMPQFRAIVWAMASNPRNSAEFWRDKAEEARAMSEQFHDSVNRLAMLEVAAQFERSAATLEALKGHLNPTHERKAG